MAKSTSGARAAQRARKPVAKPAVECAADECSTKFTPQRSDARYCSKTCRQRAYRERVAADESVSADRAAGRTEHDLVRAVRLELTDAGKLMTVNGQLALHLARKITHPQGTGTASMVKELQALMQDTLGSASVETPDAPAAEVDDEVTKARKAREAKAAAAASST